MHSGILNSDQRTEALKVSLSSCTIHCLLLTYHQWFFLFEVFYCISIIFIKTSIAFMLVRIAGPMKNFVWSLYACIAVFVTMNLIALFYIVFQCQPVSYGIDVHDLESNIKLTDVA